MAQQLTFDLPVRPALGREDFFVSPSNAVAVSLIDAWRDWPQRKLLLCGPKGAGKSHLAQVWIANSGATRLEAGDLAAADIPALLTGCSALAIEDVDQIAGNIAAENALFHLHNLMLAEGGTLLMTARGAPLHWGLSLPDLQSRLQGTQVATLAPPDDALLAALLVKLFADHQLTVTPTLIPYLVARVERSFVAAQELVVDLDRSALATGRKVSEKLASELIEKAQNRE